MRIPRPKKIPGGQGPFLKHLKRRHAEVSPRTPEGKRVHLYGWAQDYFRKKLGFPETFKKLQTQELILDRATNAVLAGQPIGNTLARQLMRKTVAQIPLYMSAHEQVAGTSVPPAEVKKLTRLDTVFREALGKLDTVRGVRVPLNDLALALNINAMLQIKLVGVGAVKEYTILMAWAGAEFEKIVQ
jgi:hypothetical protein